MSKRREIKDFLEVQESSENFGKQVERLKATYGSWRDVKTDGNCMYRACAWQLLECLCSPSTPLADFEEFYRRFRWQELSVPDSAISDYIVVCKSLYKLLEERRKGDPSRLEVLEDEDFMDPLVCALRNVALQSILAFKPQGIYWEGCEEDMIENFANGRLSGEQDLAGLSTGLDVSLKQTTMGRNDYSETVTEYTSLRENKKCTFTAHLALVSGHFYALYPKESQF